MSVYLTEFTVHELVTEEKGSRLVPTNMRFWRVLGNSDKFISEELMERIDRTIEEYAKDKELKAEIEQFLPR